MDGQLGDIRQVLKDHPGPPIKGHRHDIRDEPILFRTQEYRFDQFQPPHEEDGKYGQKSIAEHDVHEPEDLVLTAYADKGVRVEKDQECHDIGIDEQRVKKI